VDHDGLEWFRQEQKRREGGQNRVAPETTQSENSADGERWGVHKRVTPRLG
jgi:hypothetical protein